MIRVPVSVCVPAPPGVFLPYGVCPGSPRTCLFSFYRHCTGTGRTRDTDTRVQYRNVPCVSRLTPVSFYRCFLPPVSFTGAFSSGVGSPTGIKQVPVKSDAAPTSARTALLDAVAAVWHVDQCERAQTTVSLRITHELVAEHVHSQVRDTTCCSQRRSALTSVQRICSRHQRNTHSRAAGEPHRCDRRCFNGCKLVVCDGLSSRPNGASSTT